MKRSAFTALQFSNLRIYLLGFFISTLGSTMQVVAVGWHVYEMTHSPFALGFVGLAGFLPIIFTFLPGGVIADSFDRRKVLFITNTLFGIGAFILAFATIGHWVTPLLIYMILAINAVLVTVDLPARGAIIPLLVPKEYIFGSVSLNTVIRQTGAILGPALAGFLIALYGPQSIYLFNAISFFIMIAALLVIKVPTLGEKKSEVSIQSVKEGLQFIRHSPLLYSTMLLDFFVTFLAGAVILFPVFAKDVLHISVEKLGLLYAAPSVGAVLAGFILSALGNVRRQGSILFGGILLYAVSMIGFGFSHSLIISLMCLTLSGAGDMMSTLVRNNLRQLITPNEMRGRMTSISMVFFIGGPFLGDSEAGFVAGLVGAPLSVIVGGVAAALFSLGVFLKVPKLRNYQSHTDPLS